VELLAKAGIASFQKTLLVQQETQVKARLLVIGLLALRNRLGANASHSRLERLLGRKAAHRTRVGATRAAAGAPGVINAGSRGSIHWVGICSSCAVLASNTAGLDRLLKGLDLTCRSSLLEERELVLDFINEALPILTLELVEKFLCVHISEDLNMKRTLLTDDVVAILVTHQLLEGKRAIAASSCELLPNGRSLSRRAVLDALFHNVGSELVLG
jgi:hypothetical protein